MPGLILFLIISWREGRKRPNRATTCTWEARSASLLWQGDDPHSFWLPTDLPFLPPLCENSLEAHAHYLHLHARCGVVLWAT